MTTKNPNFSENMLSVEEARENILNMMFVLNTEYLPISDCLGQVLSEDISSIIHVPPWNNSAMDGFAVIANDTKRASENTPVKLTVIDSVYAGDMPSSKVSPNTAIRIMTGAPIPDGANAVVPFEQTNEIQQKANKQHLETIDILKPVKENDYIRFRGEDIKSGDNIFKKGTILRPSEIGVLATLGFKEIPVIRKPKIAIISTGNELTDLGEPIKLGKIYDANTYSIASSVEKYGGTPIIIGIAKDNEESLNDLLDKALDYDILVTSAGVSKGDYDIVKNILSQRGNIEFWSVNMKPAKPIAFGWINKSENEKLPLLGLPGNPVSAMVAFEQFVRPSILKLKGYTKLDKPSIHAILKNTIKNEDGRRMYIRVLVKKEGVDYYAEATGNQGSHVLTSMAKANGLAVCPENVLEIKSGQKIEVQMIDWHVDDL
ncbi:MAG: molybdopterin molybdotransferase MoeA [SAR202 cluster bacterium]|nr:molybdopterin molybdotransferase MoeA [SAR202 cluster bacterium]